MCDTCTCTTLGRQFLQTPNKILLVSAKNLLNSQALFCGITNMVHIMCRTQKSQINNNKNVHSIVHVHVSLYRLKSHSVRTPTIKGSAGVSGCSCDLIIRSYHHLVALSFVQDEQQIKHYREDTAKMRAQIAELQTT